MEDTIHILKSPIFLSKNNKMQNTYKKLKRVALTDSNVLLIGENGTYKDVFAEAIHLLSNRKNMPFLIINLSSINVSLLEDYIFGKNMEKIKDANGGTVYFEGVTLLDDKIQNKLIEIKETKNLNDKAKMDIRFIFSTNNVLIDSKKINKEFFEKMNFEEITIPSLKERKEDIVPLAEYFMDNITKRFEIEPKKLSKDAKECLKKYEWPGNLKELENTIKRIVLLSNSKLITKNDLIIENIESHSIKEFFEEKLKKYLEKMIELGNSKLYDTVMSEVEKALITIVLEATNFCQTKTAKTLGINRNTLRAKIKEYRIIQ